MTLKSLKVKNELCYCWNDMIYLENFDEKFVKVVKRESRIDADIYYVSYEIKSSENKRINALYLIVRDLLGKIELIKGSKDKYLVIDGSNKKVLDVFEHVGAKIDKINSDNDFFGIKASNKIIDYDKLRLCTDLELPIEKLIEFHSLTVVVTLWLKAKEIVELKNVAFDKLSMQDGEYDAKYSLKDYVIEYNGGGFWLTISDLKGYFTIVNGVGLLELIFKNNEQKLIYDKIWQWFLNAIGRSDGFMKDTKKITMYDGELPVNREFLINKITIVIKSVVEWKNVFYPQISLNYCSCDV